MTILTYILKRIGGSLRNSVHRLIDRVRKWVVARISGRRERPSDEYQD